MKRILLSVVMSILVFINSIFVEIRTPQLMNGYIFTDQPELEVFEEQAGIGLAKFYGNNSVHDGFAKVYIDTVGVTRFFISLYDENYKISQNYVIRDTDEPKLELSAGEIIGYSKPIWLGNEVIFYYHTSGTTDGSSRHKLMVIDVSNLNEPIFRYVSLSTSGVARTVTTDQVNSDFNLEYINNKLVLTASVISNDLVSYSFSEINYDLNAPLTGNYYSGTINGIVNSNSILAQADLETSFATCKVITTSEINQVVCIDLENTNNRYLYDLPEMDIETTTMIHNKYYSGTKDVNDQYIYKIYSFELSDTFDSLDAVEISSFEVNSQTIFFNHIDYSENKIKLYTENTLYSLDLSNNEVVQEYRNSYDNVKVLYNELGQKLKVNYPISNYMLVTEDFFQLTHIINTYGYSVRDFNYYDSRLLFVAYDGTNRIIKYFSYDFDNPSENPTLVAQFNEQTIINALNEVYGQEKYTTENYYLLNYKFLNDKIYVSENGSESISTNNFNFLELLPNSIVIAHSFNVDGDLVYDNFDFTLSNDQIGELYALLHVFQNGSRVEQRFYFGSENNDPTTIYGTSSPIERVASFKFDDQYHFYYIDINSYYLIYEIQDINGDILETFNLKLPSLALESLNNRLYGVYYTDFSTQFPYSFINFSLDSYNNLLINDAFANTHIVFNPNLRSDAHPGIIGVNGDYTYNINNTSFDILVSNTINTISLVTDAFFKRVLVTNSSPFNLNEGLNVVTTTLKALDNSIRTITFNIIRAPQVSLPPPIILPGLDPNYVSSSSSSASSSSVSSSISSSSVDSSSSSSSISSSITNSSSSSSAISSSINSTTSSSINSSINTNNVGENINNNGENPLILVILAGLPAVITIVLYIYIIKLKKKSKLRDKGKSRSKSNDDDNSKGNIIK